MAKKQKLTKLARARIDENTHLKIMAYSQRHHCSDSDVVREALKNFLRYVSTKRLQINGNAVKYAATGK